MAEHNDLNEKSPKSALKKSHGFGDTVKGLVKRVFSSKKHVTWADMLGQEKTDKEKSVSASNPKIVPDEAAHEPSQSGSKNKPKG